MLVILNHGIVSFRVALCRGREEPEDAEEHSRGEAGDEGGTGMRRANLYTIGSMR